MVNWKKMLAVSMLSVIPCSSLYSSELGYLNKQPKLEQVVIAGDNLLLREKGDFMKKFGKEELNYDVEHRYFKGRLEIKFKKAEEPKFDYRIDADLYIEEYKSIYNFLKFFIALSGTPTNLDKISMESNIVVREGKLVTLERTQSYFNGDKLEKQSTRIYDHGRRIITKKKKIGENVSMKQYKMKEGVDYYEDLFSLIYNIRAGALGELKPGISYTVYTQSRRNTLKLNFSVKNKGEGLLNVSSDLNQKSSEFDLEDCILLDDKNLNYPMQSLILGFHGKLKLELKEK